MDKKRTCAYCGGSHQNRTCKCKYRFNRKRIDGLNGGCSFEAYSTTAQTTLEDMLNSIKESLPVSIKDPDKAIGTWRWSFDKAEPVETKSRKGAKQ